MPSAVYGSARLPAITSLAGVDARAQRLGRLEQVLGQLLELLRLLRAQLRLEPVDRVEQLGVHRLLVGGVRPQQAQHEPAEEAREAARSRRRGASGPAARGRGPTRRARVRLLRRRTGASW